jgi:ribose 1,5-bisphosphokinase
MEAGLLVLDNSGPLEHTVERLLRYLHPSGV